VAKRKLPALRIFDRIHQPAPPDPARDGLYALQGGKLDEAIGIWRAISPQTNELKTALAEAYVRRALLNITNSTALADLRRAERLQPTDRRVRYLLGLAAHRTGNLAEAGACYRTVLQADPVWPGAGLLLGLLTLRQDPQADLAALPGSTPEIQSSLAPVQTLLRGGQPAPGADAVQCFWYGLGLIRAGDGSAREALEDTRPLPAARVTALRRYYRGVAAAQRGDLAVAFKAWQHVSGDLDSQPWLAANLAAVLLQGDTIHLNPQTIEGDSSFAQHLRALARENAALAELLVRYYDDSAHHAAAAGHWQAAAAHWEQARELVSGTDGLGSPRPFWHNLALAYEALEHWSPAADAWRAMLRTRPRGAKRAARSEGEYSDAQWTWIGKRVVECYRKADTPGEAVSLFRQALKKDPTDLDTRMQLAEALMANDQEQAAINELNRLIQIAPEHLDATLMLAALHGERGDLPTAQRLLRAAHEAHPEREDVARALVEQLNQEGHRYLGNGWYDRAIVSFEEAEKLAPDDWRFPLNLARAYVDKGKRSRAKVRPLLERAEQLAGDDPAAYLSLIECWAVAGEIKEARAALERAEAATVLPDDFHTVLATTLLDQGVPSPFLSLYQEKDPPAPRHLAALAEEVVEHGAVRHAGNAKYFRDAASALMLGRTDAAERMADQAARLDPDSAEILSIQGTIQALNGRTEVGRRTLRDAARRARKAGNPDLARQSELLAQLAADPRELRIQLRMALAIRQVDMEGMLDEFG
jgi:tetratricopeptide (TPR) repeat protein